MNQELQEIKDKLDSQELSYESLKTWIHCTRTAKIGLYNLYLSTEKTDAQLISMCREYRKLQKLAKSKIKKLYPCKRGSK